MISKLFKYLERPEVYAESSAKFWDDEHISKEMLKCHLNPTLEAASRKHAFIDKSVEWIQSIASPETNKKILDIGCGPGMYTQRLFSKGYSVTGIDFSKRSIDYAKEQANLQKSDIEYIYKNYLEIDYADEFDVILLIYCDFAVLSHNQRKSLLEKVYSAMREGGKFIFDVFTPKNFENDKESSHWYVHQGSGFWRPDTHLCLEGHYIYEDNIRLSQFVILDQEEKVEVIRVWERCYTKEMIIDELEKVGFKNIKVYSDVSGKEYHEESKTMCIVTEK
jgi:SAM-dependent methyltransferase